MSGDGNAPAPARPRVSVIIPTYNRAAMVVEAVRSVLEQGFRDLEVIVVDDGSTDDTPARLAGLDPRLRVLRQPNAGCSAARNAGIRAARGELIAFHDSDDLWTPGRLERQVAFLDAHPDVDMVCGNGTDPGKHPGDAPGPVIPEPRASRLARRGVTLRDMLERSCSRTPTLVARRRVIETTGGFDPRFVVCADSEFMYRVLLRFRVAFLNEPLFMLGRHTGHLGTDTERRCRFDLRALHKLARQHPEAVARVGRRAFAKRLSYRYYRLGRALTARGANGAARKCFREALRLRPGYLRAAAAWVRAALAARGRAGEEKRARSH